MQPISVHTTVHASLEKCWQLWTNPADILQFNNPFEDWHTTKVVTDLKAGGRLFYRMESKDGRDGFDFAGTYDKVDVHSLIESTGDDGRKTINKFTTSEEGVTITEIFEPDPNTPLDLQKKFCQGILDSFKKYAEKA